MGKNILFIIPKNDVGGAPKFVREQLLICHRHNLNCFLATHAVGWINDGNEDKIKATLYHKGILKIYSLSFLICLIKFVHHHKIDLIVCNSANGGLYGRIAAFLLRKKSIYVTHGWSSVYNGGKIAFILNFIERMLSWLGTYVLCISSEDAKKAIEKIRVPKRKIKVIPNAIFRVSDNKKQVPEWTPGKFSFITVTRFRHPKRVDLLIEVFSQSRDVELYIAGDGVERDELERKLKSKHISNIHFLGEIPDFNSYHQFDAFILLSNSEGLPMSAIEAMSAGLPLVLSNVGGCPQLIKDNGILVENNIESVTKGIRIVQENKAVFSANSIKLFNENFNLENRMHDFIHLYRECM